MENKLILSEPATIKRYFEKVRQLHKLGKDFPVDLDDVWPLVYKGRSEAVRALQSNYIEKEDFVIALQGSGAKRGGHNKKYYMLSTSCFEHFIARKVKEVFDVYREVFHKTADIVEQQTKPLSQIEILLQSVQMLAEQDKRINQVENKISLLEAKTTTRPDYFTIVGYAVLNRISVSLSLASKLGRKASAICKNRQLLTDEIPDPRFGVVKMYPKEVLQEVFYEAV